jgi:hypothetical protein
MDFHPLSNIFPLIEGGAFDALVADIADHGIRDPLIVYEDMILDGRNRWRAAQRANVTVTAKLVRQFNPEKDGDPLAWVISKNLQRRHLDESQRSMVGARIANLPKGVRSDSSIELSAVTQDQAAIMSTWGWRA